MKINNVKLVSFQKRHIANCSIIKEEKPEQCKIYRMEKSDLDYFKKLKVKDSWQDAHYLENIDAMMKYRTLGGRQIYSMEDSENNCIAFCEVDHECNDSDILEFIEVAPTSSSNNKERKTKYAGETMLSFLTGYAIQNGKQTLIVDSPTQEAKEFYSKKCGMTERKTLTRTDFIIDEEGIDALLKRNKLHTGSEIEYRGKQWTI